MNNKIAIVRTSSSSLNPQGYNIQEIGMAKELIKLGYTVDFYSRFQNIKSEIVLDSCNGNTLSLIPLNGITIWKEIIIFPSLIDTLISKKYDFVQVHDDTQFMNPFIVRVCKQNGSKTILIQGMYRGYAGLKAFFQKTFDFFLKNMLIKYTDLVFAKTNYAKEYLEQKGYKNILDYPIGLDIVTPEENDFLERQISHFANQHTHVMLYIGVIDQRRDVGFLIDLLAELNTNDDKIGLVIVGRGVGLDEVNHKILQYNLRKNVLYFDFVKNNNMHILYKYAQVSLLPTKYEIWGMVILESLYYGVPVIATPEAGPKSVLVKKLFGTCILLDIQQWKESILFYLENYCDTKDRDEMIIFIKHNFNWKILAKKYQEVIGN